METEYPRVKNGPEVYLQSTFPQRTVKGDLKKKTAKQYNTEINQ